MSEVPNSMVMLIFFYFWPKLLFLRKFILKCQSCQFKLKFCTYTNSNMQNSMVIFTFSICDWKYPFWVNFVEKIKIVSLGWILVPRLIIYVEFNFDTYFFCFFLGKFGPKQQNCPFKLNLVPRLIRICKIK